MERKVASAVLILLCSYVFFVRTGCQLKDDRAALAGVFSKGAVIHPQERRCRD